MSMLKMSDINLFNKRVLIRSDLNVPIQNGKISSDTRIRLALPTIKKALEEGAKVMVTSHLGRPKNISSEFSLQKVLEYMKNKLNISNIILVKNYLNGFNLKKDYISLLENVRFNTGEVENNDVLSKKYASLCDVFIMDAFATAHRKHSSTYGICKFVPTSCAGLLLTSEIKSLNKVMKNPKKPMIVVIGGSKISTKFHILKSLVKIADQIIVGGGIANTFLALKNKIGNSLYEPSYIEEAKLLYNTGKIVIPVDVRVGKNFLNTTSKVKSCSKISSTDIIMDIGEKTISIYKKILQSAKTILWNGPMGIFEFSNFSIGTKEIAKTISKSSCFSVAGGGDTLAVLDFFKIKEKISYISTGGGSFLKFIEKSNLPCIEILKKN